MKLILRLIWLLISQRFRSRCHVLGPVETKVRVFPNDLDVFFHVNNGVYLTYADLGRTDLILRSNTLGKLLKKGWYPVIAGATIELRRSLKLGQLVTITTRVMAWDDKSVYFEQVFTRDETLVARAFIDARFLSLRGERVPNDKLLKLMNIEHPSPELPNALKHWIQARKHGNMPNRDAPVEPPA